MADYKCLQYYLSVLASWNDRWESCFVCPRICQSNEIYFIIPTGFNLYEHAGLNAHYELMIVEKAVLDFWPVFVKGMFRYSQKFLGTS